MRESEGTGTGKLRMRRGVRGAAACAGAVLAALAVVAGAAAQEMPEVREVELGRLPQRVSLYLAERAQVSVTFAGDFGPVRVTGVLEEAPREALRLEDPAGRAYEARWDELRLMANTEYPTEGFPAGSFQVALLSDPPATGGSAGYRVAGILASQPGTSQGRWRLLRAPEGTLRLAGRPYGTLNIPVARITALAAVPVVGDVAEIPPAPLRLEVLSGATVSIPFAEVQAFQRNLARGTAAVTLLDEQSFTGKLVEMPDVTLTVTASPGPDSREAAPPRTVRLAEVAQFERPMAAVRRY